MELRRNGWIEAICGSMYAGKTEELIRRLTRLQYAKQRVLVFKPKLDNRYSETEVASHSGVKIPSITVDNVEELMQHVLEAGEVEAVAIDEVQFFSDTLIQAAEILANNGIRVIVAGLDKDFRGEPFGIMPTLLSQAEDVTKLTAICACCGEPATRTQRLVNGHPASYHDPIIQVGAVEAYEPRCRHCHEVLDKPTHHFHQ